MDYSEKDVETAFIDYYVNRTSDDMIYLGRQVRTAVGIVDILFWDSFMEIPFIVEVKKGRAPRNTYTQLMRYMRYFENQLYDAKYYVAWGDVKNLYCDVHGFIVAEDIDQQTKKALGSDDRINFIRYELNGGKFTFESDPPKTLRLNADDRELIQWMRDRIGGKLASFLASGIDIYISDGGHHLPSNKYIEYLEPERSVEYWRREE